MRIIARSRGLEWIRGLWNSTLFPACFKIKVINSDSDIFWQHVSGVSGSLKVEFGWLFERFPSKSPWMAMRFTLQYLPASVTWLAKKSTFPQLPPMIAHKQYTNTQNLLPCSPIFSTRLTGCQPKNIQGAALLEKHGEFIFGQVTRPQTICGRSTGGYILTKGWHWRKNKENPWEI